MKANHQEELTKDRSQANLAELKELVMQDARENGESYLSEVTQYGCQSGVVGRLIYYADTMRFYTDYHEAIAALLHELIEQTGCQPHQLFHDWDETDPLATDVHNQNLLAWFGYEQIASRLVSD